MLSAISRRSFLHNVGLGWLGGIAARRLAAAGVAESLAGEAIRQTSLPKIRLIPDKTCQVLVECGDEIGQLRLWVPEGIASNTGASSVYPQGGDWHVVEDSAKEQQVLTQRVTETQLIGGWNCPLVNEKEFECHGIRFPLDSAVRWETTVSAAQQSVDFRIKLTNCGKAKIHKAGAAICLAFRRAPWWSDDRVFVRCNGEVKSLAALGRSAGRDAVFEAYLMHGESYENPFYQRFWGFNKNRLDTPRMVSEHSRAGLCVGIEAEKAYFLHSNARNPCTDVLLAFGDVAPGETAESRGTVWIRRGAARDFLARLQDRFLRRVTG